jgi:hypothetical protein
MKRKRTENKRNEAKKSKRNEKEPKNCLTKKKNLKRKRTGKWQTQAEAKKSKQNEKEPKNCISTNVLMYRRI